MRRTSLFVLVFIMALSAFSLGVGLSYDANPFADDDTDVTRKRHSVWSMDGKTTTLICGDLLCCVWFSLMKPGTIYSYHVDKTPAVIYNHSS